MKTVRLGDVAVAIRGITFASGDVAGLPFPGSVACLTTSAVQREIDWASARYLPEQSVPGPTQLLQEGDVLVSTANSTPLVGKAALVRSVPFPSTFGAFVTVVRPRPGLDPEYLALWMQAPDYLAKARQLSSQTTSIANLRVSDLMSLHISLPSMDEQHRIAARLTHQLAAVDRARKLVGARLEGAVSLEDAIRDQVFVLAGSASTAALGDIVRAEGAIADGPFGSRLKTDHYSDLGARVIRLQNIGLGAFLRTDEAFVSLGYFQSLRRHEAQPGDVVVAALGDGARPAGRACIVPEGIGPAIVKADCFRVRTIGTVLDPEFLMHVLNAPRTQGKIAGIMRGATRPRFTLAMLRRFEVPILPLDVQKRIAGELRGRLVTIDAMTKAIEAEVEAIEGLQAALLRQTFAQIEAT